MDNFFIIIHFLSKLAITCLFIFGVYAFFFIETFTLKGCALYAFVIETCVYLKYWSYDNLPRYMKDK